MSKRTRIAAFGTSALLVLAGALCAVFIGGLAGELLTTMLIGVGLIAVVSLIFLEVGLGEDHDLEREAERYRERRLRGARLRMSRRPRRPD
jgi:hypothetical protein